MINKGTVKELCAMRIDRINQMKRYISERETVSLDELVSVFGVSKNTVRRDMDEIVSDGTYKKSYGGISVVNSATVFSSSWASRIQRAAEAKKRIAVLASALVADNSCIFIDAGTTSYALTEHLTAKQRVTVVTNSLPVIAEVIRQPETRLFALGGMFSESECSFQGESTIDMFSHLNADTAFIGTSAISLTTGLSNSTYSDAAFKRKLIDRVPRVILMTDATKFNKQALFTFCSLDALDTVITDQTPPEPFCEYFETHGVKLLVANPVSGSQPKHDSV